MNNDLISREALKEALHNEIGDHALSTAIDRVIDNAPTVCGNNPKWCESCVSKGKCVSTRPQSEWQGTGIANKCSVCGAMYSISFHEKCYDHLIMNFCPNCGADMRGGAE